MKEEQFIESKELRDQMSNRIDVLEKVKQLLLIPEMETMTAEQVANYYEVEKNTLDLVCHRNSEELVSDGMAVKPMKDFLNLQDVTFQKERNKAIVSCNNGIEFTVTNRGLKVFPRRAILRVGMLLRDSEVAKEIRTQLLNIEEKTSNDVKTKDIDTEEGLMMSVGMAVASGDATAVAISTAKMIEFKNRHIAKLEKDNKALSIGILEWEDRKKLNAGVRKLAAVTGIKFQNMWGELYKELQYKYGICLSQRNGGKKPLIGNVHENEWKNIVKTFCAICEAHGQSPTEMFQKDVPIIK